MKLTHTEIKALARERVKKINSECSPPNSMTWEEQRTFEDGFIQGWEIAWERGRAEFAAMF